MTFRLTLPCTKAEAEALREDIWPLAAMDPPPTLMTSEAEPDGEAWRLDAYFESEPDADSVALLRSLLPSAAGVEPVIERLADADWVTLSQAGLEPVRAGRFLVHTPQHRVAADGAIAFEIDAGLAFGTGHHQTTTGCLEALTRLADEGAAFGNVIDVGTGTGLLAFAARALWPEAQIMASDNDPVAVDVARENGAANGVTDVEMLVAEGVDADAIRARAPFDLVIANILAGPLIELAPDFAGVLAPAGTVMLAGLLETQADAVLAVFAGHGLCERFRVTNGDWPTLVLSRT